MQTCNEDQLILDIILPLLTGRYERLKEDFSIVLANLYVSDFSDHYNFDLPNLLIDAVEPKNKLLTHSFIKNNIATIRTAVGK